MQQGHSRRQFWRYHDRTITVAGLGVSSGGHLPCYGRWSFRCSVANEIEQIKNKLKSFHSRQECHLLTTEMLQRFYKLSSDISTVDIVNRLMLST